jgi:RNA polymerase sigma-70 factor (ECF subfamily)
MHAWPTAAMLPGAERPDTHHPGTVNCADLDLVERFGKGDRDAFAELYRVHHPGVFRFALNMTGDRGKAGELTQDVFVWLIHHAGDFDPNRGGMGAFLMGVARKLLLRQERDARRWLPLIEAIIRRPQPQVDPNRVIDAGALRKAIVLLPVKYREAVVLCDLENRNYEEAAAAAGCAVGTIRSRLHRGRDLLMRKLQSKKEVGRPPQ